MDSLQSIWPFFFLLFIFFSFKVGATTWQHLPIPWLCPSLTVNYVGQKASCLLFDTLTFIPTSRSAPVLDILAGYLCLRVGRGTK